MIVINIGDIRV